METFTQFFNRQQIFDFYSEHLRGLDPNKDEQKTRCPFHKDEKPSLSVNLAKGVWKCHAGCGAGGIKSFRSKLGLDSGNGVAKTIVKEYDYRDERGKLLFQTVRYSPKGFSQRRPDGNGGWICSIKGVRRIPYCLRELLQSKAGVVIVEGEKDVDSLQRKGFTATTSPMGAGKWLKDYNQFLRGRDVVIIPDNDESGRKHADQVASSLWGVASSIKIVPLPGLGEHEDVTDWFGWGHTEIELKEIIENAAVLTKRPVIQGGYAAAVQQGGTSTAQSFRLTDVGNAERFIRDHGDDLLYCEKMGKWFVFTGQVWTDESNMRVHRLAKSTVRKMYGDANEIENESERTALVKHALRTEADARINAMINRARSDAVQVKPGDFDSDPFLFNVLNGTVDLRSGNLRPHRREDRLTKIAPVRYDDSAKCPRFEAFLNKIMNSNVELCQFLQRALGYALTGDVSEQCLFFLYGVGANGKSTLINTILYLFGSYGLQAAPDILVVKYGDRHPTELADLFGRRFVATIEIGEGRRFAEALVKQLTGGDRIRARRMREDFWEFNPTHKIFLAANHKPIIRGTDYAIWRRVYLIPFTIIFKRPANPPDVNLPRILEAESSGILNWLIKGAKDWRSDGLKPPDAVVKATESYRAEMDVVGKFLDERCVQIDGAKIRASKLYDAYVEWCKATAEEIESQRKFGDVLTERGFVSEKRGGYIFRIGVGLPRGQ